MRVEKIQSIFFLSNVIFRYLYKYFEFLYRFHNGEKNLKTIGVPYEFFKKNKRRDPIIESENV